MLSHSNGWGNRCSPQMKLLLQPAQAQTACFELLLQIVGNGCFFVLDCGNVKRFDHHTGSTISLKPVEHLLPEVAILVVGQNFLLPGAVEQRPGLFPQAAHQVAVVDAAQAPTLMAWS